MNSEPRTVNLREYQLDRHVEESFRTALALAEGRPVNARHALEGAVLVSRTTDASPAFKQLASLIALPEQDLAPADGMPDADLGAFLLEPSLADSFSIAEPFFRQAKVIWGRDYVTFALLTLAPSLRQLVTDGPVGLASLRDVWFEFLTSTDEHRGRDSWAMWWHQANVPLPHERILSPSGRTFLLTWDPTRAPFSNIATVALRAAQEGSAFMNWSVGHRDISSGDRVFMMRHGQPPRGFRRPNRRESSAGRCDRWRRRQS